MTHSRRSTHKRHWLFFATLLLLICTKAPFGPSAYAIEPVVMDARIGGTVISFESKYGNPTNSPTSDIKAVRAYENPNYDNLAVQAVDGYVYHVNFYANSNANWSVRRATTLAQRFLPSDTECGVAPAPVDRHVLIVCRSVALTAIMFPADYDRTFRTGESGSITIDLTVDKSKPKRVTAIDTNIGTGAIAELDNTSTAGANSGSDAAADSPVAEAAYLSALGADDLSMAGSMDTIAVLFEDWGFSDISDPTWKSQLSGALDTWEYVHARAVARYVPAKYADLNAEWLAVTTPFNSAAGDLRLGIDTVDFNLIIGAFTDMDAGVAAHNIFIPDYAAALDGADPGQSL
jgi:hypothetical protein